MWNAPIVPLRPLILFYSGPKLITLFNRFDFQITPGSILKWMILYWNYANYFSAPII